MKSKGKPLGKSQRGKQRKFTNFEELQVQAEKLARKKERGDDESEEDSEEESEEVETSDDSSEPEDSSGEEGEEHKPKGVESLIDIENPNRRRPKKEATDPNAAKLAGSKPKAEVKPELSRREREELEKQRRAVASISLKSEQARSDMARLALIRAERAQAALKREAAKQQAAVAAAAKK